ncbi:ubiquinol-cytochrome C chaperone-domain-containing protein [Aspergillus spinulosporus]
MPSRYFGSLWSQYLTHQSIKFQTQFSKLPLSTLTSTQRSLCTLSTNSREAVNFRLPRLELQNASFRRRTSAQFSGSKAQGCRYASGFLPRLAKKIVPMAQRPGGAAEQYIAYGMTQRLFEACSKQGDYTIPQLKEKGAQVPKTEAGEDLGVGEGWWYKELGLVPTFSTWSQITFLHMYLLMVRLRALPSHDSLQTYSRHLIDHFSHNAEYRMDVLHGLTSRAIRNKFLKDLFIQWRGVLAAYDEGLIKGDAVLGAAVWRNLWKASYNTPDGKEMDWEKVARVVAYMRRVLSELSELHEADLILGLGSLDGDKPGIFSPSKSDMLLVKGKP